MKRCYSCFRQYDEQLSVCPYCGEPIISKPSQPIYLNPGTILVGRYIVGKDVGAGGFGIVYRAWDTKLEMIVAVKEFYLSRVMTRAEGNESVIINRKSQVEFEYRKQRFLAEARNLAMFGSHRNIPNVYEFFEANGTAYIVMELLEGMPLNKYLERNREEIDPNFAIYITNEVGNALKALNDKGIVHRDVSPDNIFICSEKTIRVKLMDLGAAKLMDSTDEYIDIVTKPGYSPVEQYIKGERVGPYTDVYALGATLYVLLTGRKPPESTNRKSEAENGIADLLLEPKSINPNIPQYINNALMRALSIEKQWRFQTVDAFLSAINRGQKVRSVEQEKKHKRYRRLSGILLAIAVLTVVAVVVAGIYHKKMKEGTLEKATIVVWFIDRGDQAKEEALKEIFNDFIGKFEKVTIEYRAIEESKYESELAKAAQNGDFPTLFESTGVSDSFINDEAKNLREVLQSSQAGECLFLDQYKDYYDDYKRIPLAIEVPVAYVITNGPVSIPFAEDYFESTGDFSVTQIAADTRFRKLLEKNISILGMPEEETFFVKYYGEDGGEDKKPTSPVLLSSTMTINEVRDLSYIYHVAFFRSEEIRCCFTYEWSIIGGTEAEMRAAKRLLEWMLGNAYQQKLMVNAGSGSIVAEIPINKESFMEKLDRVGDFAPILKIYKSFRFN